MEMRVRSMDSDKTIEVGLKICKKYNIYRISQFKMSIELPIKGFQ